jgi:hypothetical protein
MTKLSKMTSMLLGMGVAATMAAAPALAGDPEYPEFTEEEAIEQEPGAPSFAELDVDGDGVVSREEAAAHPPLLEVFDDADADGTGALDFSQFQTALNLLAEEDEEVIGAGGG